MKALVIYDSKYGYTEKIAKAIGAAIGEEARVMKVGDVKVEDIAAYSYIIIGSPTQGGRMTPAMKTFLDSLPADIFRGKRFAAFDTRMKSLFVKMFGWAAAKIEASIKEKGGNTTAQPQGFFVKSGKGPLADGELERATVWAKSIVAGVPTKNMPGDFQFKQKE
jgi:flavodoxin I